MHMVLLPLLMKISYLWDSGILTMGTRECVWPVSVCIQGLQYELTIDRILVACLWRFHSVVSVLWLQFILTVAYFYHRFIQWKIILVHHWETRLTPPNKVI
jgi:hypothetical protein